MTRVYVGGTFDLFHPGHIALLKAASELGEVWVALNTDEFAGRYKRPPIMTLRERAAMVSSCKFVHSVIVNHGGEDSKPAILNVRPQIIVHGDDWTGPAYMQQLAVNESWLDQWGIQLVYLPYTAEVSTTDLIGRCAA